MTNVISRWLAMRRFVARCHDAPSTIGPQEVLQMRTQAALALAIWLCGRRAHLSTFMVVLALGWIVGFLAWSGLSLMAALWVALFIAMTVGWIHSEAVGEMRGVVEAVINLTTKLCDTSARACEEALEAARSSTAADQLRLNVLRNGGSLLVLHLEAMKRLAMEEQQRAALESRCAQLHDLTALGPAGVGVPSAT